MRIIASCRQDSACSVHNWLLELIALMEFVYTQLHSILLSIFLSISSILYVHSWAISFPYSYYLTPVLYSVIRINPFSYCH